MYYFVPAVFVGMAIPAFYALYVWYKVYTENLLPLTGKTRFLYLYFLRLLVIFFVLWFFFIGSLFMERTWWLAFVFVAINSTGFISFCFALTKPDVHDAVMEFIFCRDPSLRSSDALSSRGGRSSRGKGTV